MPGVETLLPNPSQPLPEALPPVETHDRVAADAEPIGSLALGNTIDIDADLELLTAQANGVDVRAEDTGRVHDIEAAYAAAVHENEMFDLHAEALLEDEARSQAIQKEEILAEKATQAEADQIQAAEEAEISEAEQPTIRAEAERSLQEAGATMSPGAEVRKDVATGNLMIVGKDTVQVLESQPGGTTRVMKYDFHKDQGTITISARGFNTITAQVGDFAPTSAQEAQQQNNDVISLPPAIARMTGSKMAVRIP